MTEIATLEPEHPTEPVRAFVRERSKCKTNISQVAREVGLTVHEFKRYYENDWELGREEAQTDLLEKLLKQGLAGNHNAAVKYFELMGFAPAKRIEHTGPAGGPIQTVDLSRLTPAQLEEYGRLAAIAEGLDPATILIEHKPDA